MLYRLVTKLVRPFVVLLVLIAVLQLLAWRDCGGSRRRTRWLTILILLLYIYCTPAFTFFALGSLEWLYPPLLQRPDDVQAIVVLSGGIYEADSVRPKARLNCSSVARCLRGAELYHEGPPCKVLLTGGTVEPGRAGPHLSEAMEVLMLQLGVDQGDILLETQSRSTYENAVHSATILREHGIDSILLVTDATHLLRGVRCFEAQGIRVVAAGCRYRATEFWWSPFCFLPGSLSPERNHEAFHEWLGMAWYKLKGRI
jgi:uncharacterized SAM-binding protein YcdF (DUF218 family)